MKKKVLSVGAMVLCASILVYLTVQTIRIDEKLSHIARPSRLFNPKLIESHFLPKKEWDVKITSDHNRFFYVVSQQKRLLAHASSRKRSLGAGMAATNNNNVKF